MNMQFRQGPAIIIIGGGIGGLTAALALQHFGIRVAVFEQAPELREVGAGIVLTPNAMHVLDHLGVGARVADEAGPPAQYRVCDYRDGRILEQGPDPASFQQDFGAGYYNVHRSDLHNALIDAVRANDPDCIMLGHEFRSLDRTGAGVTAHFANGASRSADMLVGADGGASLVRASVFGDQDVNYTGQVAFRALVPMEHLPLDRIDTGCRLLVGPGRMLLQYPLRRNRIMNVIGIGREDRWQNEGWSIPAKAEEFANLYQDFTESARSLIAAIPDGALFKWGLRDREPLEQWARGPVIMLGDAAHPTTPFLGQGGCMAIEDAMVLGRALAETDDIHEAFALYEGARKERANGVQLASREQGRHLQGATAGGSSAGRTAAARGLFDYNPVSIALGRRTDQPVRAV